MRTVDIIKGFINLGWIEQESSSRKYRKFLNPKNPDTFYWIGKAGAIRRGRISSNTVDVKAVWVEVLKLHGK